MNEPKHNENKSHEKECKVTKTATQNSDRAFSRRILRYVCATLILVLISVVLNYQRQVAYQKEQENYKEQKIREERIHEPQKNHREFTKQFVKPKPQKKTDLQSPKKVSNFGSTDQYKEDILDVQEYDNVEDFYDDNKDRFEDEEEAQDYYDEHGGE
ncbi:MAG: hypothetical protein Q4D52_04220 [Eubacteriales bacterium]|nr:hypothetical protein [Eubacteriales bacterium]